MNPFEGKRPNLGPPQDVEPAALLRKLMDSRPPNEVIDYPRKDDDGAPVGQLALRILTPDEIENATANAEAHVRRKLQSASKDRHDAAKQVNQQAWQELFESARAIELLYVACRVHDDLSKTLFNTPKDIRDFATLDEIATLLNQYEALQFRFGPQWRLLTEDECEDWIKTLEAGIDTVSPLGLLSLGQCHLLIKSLVSRYGSLVTDKSSDGSPSNAGTPDNSQTADLADNV
jgi:hypothetical protein